MSKQRFQKGDSCRVVGMVFDRSIRMNATFLHSFTDDDGDEMATVRLTGYDAWRGVNRQLTVPMSTIKYR